jgi:hypothetical protein
LHHFKFSQRMIQFQRVSLPGRLGFTSDSLALEEPSTAAAKPEARFHNYKWTKVVRLAHNSAGGRLDHAEKLLQHCR